MHGKKLWKVSKMVEKEEKKQKRNIKLDVELNMSNNPLFDTINLIINNQIIEIVELKQEIEGYQKEIIELTNGNDDTAKEVKNDNSSIIVKLSRVGVDVYNTYLCKLRIELKESKFENSVLDENTVTYPCSKSIQFYDILHIFGDFCKRNRDNTILFESIEWTK